MKPFSENTAIWDSILHNQARLYALLQVFLAECPAAKLEDIRWKVESLEATHYAELLKGLGQINQAAADEIRNQIYGFSSDNPESKKPPFPPPSNPPTDFSGN